MSKLESEDRLAGFIVGAFILFLFIGLYGVVHETELTKRQCIESGHTWTSGECRR